MLIYTITRSPIATETLIAGTIVRTWGITTTGLLTAIIQIKSAFIDICEFRGINVKISLIHARARGHKETIVINNELASIYKQKEAMLPFHIFFYLG